MIGSSDGKQYESEFDLALGRPVPPPEKPTGAPKVDPGMVRPPGTLPGMKPYPEQPGNPMHDREALPINIDREHHVPLVASALTDDKGEMYGIAIDHRIPPKPEYEKHLINHEAYENDYMNDLVKNGMSSQDAYHKAHDWSTARESAAVTAEFGEKGLEDYKQHWRDAASIAAEPTDRPRHPDAHTTKHSLDESELGRSFPREAIFRGLKGAGITMTDAGFDQHMEDTGKMHPSDVLNPVSTMGTMAGPKPQPWFKGGEGKRRQEIPDVDSKIKPAIENINLPFSKRVEQPILKLDSVLHHPELFKSYPELKDVNIAPTHPSWGTQIKGGASKDGSTLYLKPGLSDTEYHSILLHEIQHLIQQKEGFTGGSNPKEMVPVVIQAAKNAKVNPWGLEDAAAFKAYQNVGGEAEARNVQRRMFWPADALHMFPPHSTEDVSRDKQLNPPK